MSGFIDNHKNFLLQRSVRICCAGKQGSGVLYCTKTSDFAYIFTVLHCIKFHIQNPDNNPLKLYCPAGEITCSILDEKLFVLNPEGDRLQELSPDQYASCINFMQYKNKFTEACCLRLPVKNMPILHEEYAYPWLKIDDSFIYEKPVICYGYPSGEGAIQLPGKFLKYISNEQTFECQATNNAREAEELRGFSGSGVFLEYEGTPALAGLVCFTDIYEKQGVFKALSVQKLITEMRSFNEDVPFSFFDKSKYLTSWDAPIKEVVRKHLFGINTALEDTVIDSLETLSKCEVPCKFQVDDQWFVNNIPDCPVGKQNCPYFWEGRLWYRLLLRITKNAIEDGTLREEQIGELKYICSESEREDLDMPTLIASMIKHMNKESSRVLKDSIFIWQSKKSTRTEKADNLQISRVINNIGHAYDMTMEEYDAYHLFYGNIQKPNFAVIHSQAITGIINSGSSIEEIKKELLELVQKVWKEKKVDNGKLV